MSPLYPFILNMWVMGNYDESKVELALSKGYIKELEKDAILATPKVVK